MPLAFPSRSFQLAVNAMICPKLSLCSPLSILMPLSSIEATIPIHCEGCSQPKVEVVIPFRRNRRQPRDDDGIRYRERNFVEGFIVTTQPEVKQG